MKDSFQMAENPFIHAEQIEVIYNIKIFAICLIHKVGALISEISTCALKRGIGIQIYSFFFIYILILSFSLHMLGTEKKQSTVYNHDCKMASCGWLWSIIWLLLMLCVAIPVGLLCAILWVILSPFNACGISGCANFLNLLQSGQQLPHDWARNMVTSKPLCG